MLAHRRRRNPQTIDRLDAPHPLVRRWVLRILGALGGARAMFGGGRGMPESISAMLGIEDDELEGSAAELHALVRRACRQAEAEGPLPPAPAELRGNIAELQALIGLSDCDCRILTFAAMIHTNTLLEEAGDLLQQLSMARLVRVLAVCLDLPEAAIQQSLKSDGALVETGLIDIGQTGVSTLRYKLDVLSAQFIERLLSSAESPLSLLRDSVLPALPGHLTLADFAHLETDLRILRPHLRGALESRRAGVNVFLYGSPGTGKSQLARTLAQDLGVELFEVASEDANGDAIQGDARLRAYRAAQRFLRQRRALLVFDETEDVFNDGGLFGRPSTAQLRKAWINRTLEENPVPTLWLSNSVGCMDAAFLRRFDAILQLKVPSRRQREGLARATCGDLLDADGLARLAAAEHLAPAVIARAGAVIRSIRGELDPAGLSDALEHLVDATLVAQQHGRLPTLDAARLPEHYDPRWLHSSADLSAMATGIERSASARLCLYGPPGTGKTAYGHWLAERLDRPLYLRKASDLIDCYVGNTEKNIAAAFREAETDRAVLLFDEVDSFLHDRRHATRSWEVSAVNEMLGQMERFNGVFIAATNLIDGIDPAALRRFDLKLKFGYLLPAAAWELFCVNCQRLVLGAPAPALRAALARIPVLAPGDFAAVARSHRFRPLAGPGALLEALQAECAFKEDGKTLRIGFI